MHQCTHHCMAICAHDPAATAWSHAGEERRALATHPPTPPRNPAPPGSKLKTPPYRYPNVLSTTPPIITWETWMQVSPLGSQAMLAASSPVSVILAQSRLCVTELCVTPSTPCGSQQPQTRWRVPREGSSSPQVAIQMIRRPDRVSCL